MDGTGTTIIEFMNTHKEYILPLAFFICMAESIIGLSLFIPSTIILITLSASLTVAGFDIISLWLAAGAGAIVGDWLSYSMGYYLERPLNNRWPLKNNPHLLKRGHDFFNRWGLMGMFAAKFIGPLRSFTPLVAGICAMPILPFAIASSLSALLWAGVILAPGALSTMWIMSH